MKPTTKLLIVGLAFLALAANAYAQSPREQLKQMVAQLQKSPDDNALREKIIKLAPMLKPSPVLPEEAKRFEGRAQFAFKNAKSSSDYLDVAREYEKAIAVAPWVPGYYADLCTIYEKAAKYAEAKKSCEFFLVSSPSAQDASDVRKRIAGLEFATEKMRPGKVFRDCTDCPEMVIIPPGSFEMGATNGEADEKPTHRVSLAQAFALGKTEITQAQWHAVMGNNPSRSKDCGDTCPVDKVSWNDAQAYIRKLNAKTGKRYRLPSEAEWEYACRADGRQEYCGSDNLDSVGWYYKNSGSGIRPVAGKQPNAFGLYDMSGNVWEWVEDSYHGDYNGAPTDGSAWQGDGATRVLRGGSQNSGPQFVRAAHRVRSEPANRSVRGLGFRVARMLP